MTHAEAPRKEETERLLRRREDARMMRGGREPGDPHALAAWVNEFTRLQRTRHPRDPCELASQVNEFSELQEAQ